jgi:predicted transcriptional regulator
MQPILVAFTPSNVRRIFSGNKKIELRKYAPPSNLIVIFEKRPMMAIVGKCKVSKIVEGDADYWCKHSDKTCMSAKEIRDYLEDKKGYGWYLSDVKLTHQIPFNMLNLKAIPSRFIYVPFNWFYQY